MLITKIQSYFTSGHERSLRAKKNILSLSVLKGLSIFFSILLVPMTIGFTSPLQYGVWLTLSSFTSWFSFFDIGLGNGLKMKLIEAIAKNDDEKARIYISTTYAILLVLVVFLWVLMFIVIKVSDWSKILNAPPSMSSELAFVALIVATSFCFQFVLKIINTVLDALQMPAISSSIDTISQAFILIQIYFLIHFSKKEGSLINLSLVTGVTSVIMLIFSSIYLFSTHLKKYLPSIKFVHLSYTKDLMSFGLKFFFLQILSILVYSTNNIIIAQLCGPNDVTIYNVAYKYMSVLNMGFSVLIIPFWSAFGEAYIKKDFAWMNNAFRNLLKIFLAMTIVGFIMMICSPIVYKIWIKDKVAIPFILTLLIYLYNIINIWSSMFSTMIYGTGKIKIQMIGSTIICLLNVPITIIACKHWGMPGLVSSQLVLSILNGWHGPIQIKKIINGKANGLWNK